MLDELTALLRIAAGRGLLVRRRALAAGEEQGDDQAAERRSHREAMKSAAAGYASPAGTHMMRPASC